VTTLDIDADKQPDIVANVAEYDFPERYDSIIGFEVFEHMPYEDFSTALERLAKTARKYCFVSVPRNRRVVVSASIKVPKVRAKSFAWKVKKGKIDEPYHVWEVDHDGVTIDLLEKEFARAGMDILRRDEAFDRLFYALACARPQADGRAAG
jgi:hypothetical protein